MELRLIFTFIFTIHFKWDFSYCYFLCFPQINLSFKVMYCFHCYYVYLASSNMDLVLFISNLFSKSFMIKSHCLVLLRIDSGRFSYFLSWALWIFFFLNWSFIHFACYVWLMNFLFATAVEILYCVHYFRLTFYFYFYVCSNLISINNSGDRYFH